MAAAAWTYDCQVLKQGPATPSSASSPYYDKAFRAAAKHDSEPDILIPFAESILGKLGISRQALAVYAELERANKGKYISQSPMGQLLSLLFRFRVPGSEDKGNVLYRNAIEAWPAYATIVPAGTEADHPQDWYTARRPSQKSLTFNDDQITKLTGFLRAWRSAVDLDLASGFKFIMTVNKPDRIRDQYRLATHMLLYGLSYTMDLMPVTTEAKQCMNIRLVLNALQKTIMRKQYPAIYGAMPPNDAPDSGSFVTLSATRQKLVAAYCRLRSDPSLKLMDLCKEYESKVSAKGTVDVRFIEDLSWEGWPSMTHLDRQNNRGEIKKFLESQRIDSSMTRGWQDEWTVREEIILLKLAFELKLSETADIALAMRQYGSYPTAQACKARLLHLRTHDADTPMDLLQATMPNWWNALGLPREAWRASDWLYEGGRRDTKHYNRASAERYEGVELTDLRMEDEQNAAWLPDQPIPSLSTLVQYMEHGRCFDGADAQQIPQRLQTVSKLIRDVCIKHKDETLGADPMGETLGLDDDASEDSD